MAELRLGALLEQALAAAAEFHAQVLPRVLAQLAERPDHLTLIFPPADYTHRAWRLAAVQALARDHAPIRINALASDSEPAIAAALAYIGTADGVTGQLLELDDTGAGAVVSSPA
jgi:hypothetical protein